MTISDLFIDLFGGRRSSVEARSLISRCQILKSPSGIQVSANFLRKSVRAQPFWPLGIDYLKIRFLA
jgi:hypothetical protein